MVDLVQKAIAIYQRIENLPQQMTQLGRRMERLNIFLVRLKEFIAKNNKKSKNAPATLYSGQVDDLGKLRTSKSSDLYPFQLSRELPGAPETPELRE